MSRIGNAPIEIPASVKVDVKDGSITVTGPKGELSRDIPEGITVTIDGGEISFARTSEDRKTKSLHGLSRSLVNNMIQGVSEEFTKTLIVEGVGFKSSLSGKTIKLSLGFSHDVEYILVDGVNAVVDKNKITISGIDKQLVGQVAAEIRKLRKPEPYKGKGIRYDGEYIIRKEGKTAGS